MIGPIGSSPKRSHWRNAVALLRYIMALVDNGNLRSNYFESGNAASSNTNGHMGKGEEACKISFPTGGFFRPYVFVLDQS
jgi:hypothetical protein